ncbi:class I SAM-dependent rRNA methyltransferase [Deinococcus radiophilus]|uniref:Class I SAM-dependent rRNA methyltransferase n=2 Tax=Deinococcus radiophilus TaxID=32062 RepID=A0A431W5I2_9DEIO|nr:class I SAM-dependent methyltransferase [Deinococcus radiophilus]RTR30722.1 class I SAM-dependent rRNA methyltransferase [Deinococcus radiophilus]UFA51275.1 class I SAM-dependent methyltransferase [Deinococcus radiophilus]
MTLLQTPDLEAAAALREPLMAEGSTFYRLLHTTESAGLCSLDRLGTVGVLSLYRELAPAQEAAVLAALQGPMQALGIETLYLKRRPEVASHRANTEREWLAPAEPQWGTPQPEITCTEEGVPFLFRPGGDLSVGLFADARPMRAWVRGHSAGRRVLNLFAYTCGFGVSAALGGAQAVKNVDLSRRVLAWGQENYALSGLSAPDTDFLYGDVFDWLRRLSKRGERFDLIVLDPPSFARRGKQIWRAERDYTGLTASVAGLLDPGGLLLSMTNHAGMSPRVFRQAVGEGMQQAGRRGQLLDTLSPGPDFPGADHLKALVWQLD